jgi:CubicO group peptidase (beta-lactamase class C family)
MGTMDIKDQINEYMELYTKLWAFSGSIAAIKDGKVIFEKAYGYANIEHKVKNTTETKYKIWSITKQFTAVAILLLEELGLLKLEDSLKKYFPEYGELNPNITIHHLLTHTSGIFNYSSLPNSHETFQRMNHKKSDLIKMFLSKPLDFEPGTQWNYSNTGYYLLGMLIEKLSGKTYSEFLTENIFLKLGMFNTGVDDDKKIVLRKASGYYLNGNELINCNYINMDLMLSSGGMYSTVGDLLIWNQALNSGKLLSIKSIEKMNTPYKNNYGYGVSINMNGDRRVVHHNGSCEGFLSEIHRYVDDDFAVVVLSNYGFTATNKLCKTIASIAFGEEYLIPVKPEVYPMSEKLLESYLGVYEETDFKLELKKEKDNIELVIDDEYILPVYAISENTLHHTWIDEDYTFEKDDKGQLCLWGIKKKNTGNYIRYANLD